MGLLDRLRGGGGHSKDEPDAVTKEVAACLAASSRLQAATPAGSATVRVDWPSGQQSVLDIGELRRRLADLKGMDRIETLDEFVESLQEPLPGAGAEDSGPQHRAPREAPAHAKEPAPDRPPVDVWSEVSGRLLPIVRRLDQRADGDATAEPVGSLLCASVALDGVPVSDSLLAEWGRGQQDLWAAAFANLGQHLPQPEPIGAGMAAWIITTPPGHQSGWLTNPAEIVAALHLHRAIAFAPTPTDLLVVAHDRVDLLTTITTDTITIFERGEGSLTPVPHEITHTEVRPWEPADDHPCAELVRRTREL